MREMGDDGVVTWEKVLRSEKPFAVGPLALKSHRGPKKRREQQQQQQQQQSGGEWRVARKILC